MPWEPVGFNKIRKPPKKMDRRDQIDYIRENLPDIYKAHPYLWAKHELGGLGPMFDINATIDFGLWNSISIGNASLPTKLDVTS